MEIGAKAAQFPEKEYINGIAVAVWARLLCILRGHCLLLLQHPSASSQPAGGKRDTGKVIMSSV